MGKLKKKEYENLLESMQVELNSLARWLKHTGTRMLVLIEGRDTAGKGGLISAIAERLNPRQVHVVALSKPTERERRSGTFSATCRISLPRASSCSSIAAGITVRVSRKSWGTARAANTSCF